MDLLREFALGYLVGVLTAVFIQLHNLSKERKP